MSTNLTDHDFGLTDLDVSSVTGAVQYDRYIAFRSTQGGRTVFTIQVALTDVPLVLPVPDPERPTLGNRRVNIQHARNFGKYIRETPDWLSPPLLVRDEGQCKFESIKELPGGMTLGYLEVPRTSKIAMKIIDGQHRVLGDALELKEMEHELDQLKEELARAKGDGERAGAVRTRIKEIEATYSRFQSEHFTLQIYVEDEPIRYEQMFFDVADNALGINQAVKVRFDSRKVLNRTLYEVGKHALLKDRVDEEQDRIAGGNKNIVGAKHVIDIVRSANVGVTGRIGKKREAEFGESTLVETTNDFLDCLLEGFAKPLEELVQETIDAPTLRANSLLGSVTMLRVLAGVYHELTEEDWSSDDIKDFFVRLSPHMSAPVRSDSIWMPTTDFAASASGPFARSQNLKHLADTIVGWAKNPPKDL